MSFGEPPEVNRRWPEPCFDLLVGKKRKRFAPRAEPAGGFL